MSGAGANTPVIVGVAQLANKDSSRLVSALTLAHEAVMRAVADSTTKLLEQIDAVYAPPSSVFAPRTLADELAELLGVTGPSISATFSGAAPLTLLASACEAVMGGTARVALVAGAVAEASVKQARLQGVDSGPQAAPWSQGSDARRDYKPDDERYKHFQGAEMAARIVGPSDLFALLESSMAHEAGRNPQQQRVWLGELMAPFTVVAATRPDLAWQPTVRRSDELSTVTADNRMVTEPYPKRMNSFPLVDLAAAVFVTTDSHADELGIANDQRVYPWSAGHCKEIAPPSGRPVFHRSRALRAAIESCLRGAQLGVDDISAFDLYSCFPAAVQLSMHVLGVTGDDPRGLTLTGGLPYFGGPGATYVTHAIVSAVERCREASNDRTLVVGLGGAPSDFAAAVFSAQRPSMPWTIDRCDEITPLLEAERVPVENNRDGEAVVDAMTIAHDRITGPSRVLLVARFADGVRVGASSEDPVLVNELSGTSLVGERVRIVHRNDRIEFDVG